MSHTASGVVTIYNYDNNGNTISTYVGGNFGGGYTYDLFNRQKTYTPDGTVFTTTTYRPDGLRHSIGTTKHIWDAGNIVGDITGSTYKQYFRALNLIYSLIGTTKQYYRFNGHGDVVALTNSSGTVVKTYTYNAFGEEQNIDATDANPFRYCGEYYDKVSGTLYLRARNYNATIGRFTQEDPIRADSNFYAYCGSDPVNAWDPMGLSHVDAMKSAGKGLPVEMGGGTVEITTTPDNTSNTDEPTANTGGNGEIVKNNDDIELEYIDIRDIEIEDEILNNINSVDVFLSDLSDVMDFIYEFNDITPPNSFSIAKSVLPVLKIFAFIYNMYKNMERAKKAIFLSALNCINLAKYGSSYSIVFFPGIKSEETYINHIKSCADLLANTYSIFDYRINKIMKSDFFTYDDVLYVVEFLPSNGCSKLYGTVMTDIFSTTITDFISFYPSLLFIGI